MKALLNEQFQVADAFVMNTIVSVDELADHDMIYIYHHLKLGAVVHLSAAGTNVKGDLRFQVSYKGFTLGFITLSPAVRSVYQKHKTLQGQVIGIEKQKFLPICGLDISLQATKMRMVS